MFMQVFIELRASYIGFPASCSTNTLRGLTILNTNIRILRCVRFTLNVLNDKRGNVRLQKFFDAFIHWIGPPGALDASAAPIKPARRANQVAFALVSKP